MIVYKIKNKETGKFSTGGIEFKTLGKSWNSLIEIQDQLCYIRNIYSDIEIEKFFNVAKVVKIEIRELASFEPRDLI